MNKTQSQPLPQSYSVDQGIEEYVLKRVALDQALNNAIPDLYKRIVVKLYALDNWEINDIAEHAGLSKGDVSKTITSLAPRVLKAIKQVNAQV